MTKRVTPCLKNFPRLSITKWITPPTQLARHDEKSNPLSKKFPSNVYNKMSNSSHPISQTWRNDITIHCEMSNLSHQKVYFTKIVTPPVKTSKTKKNNSKHLSEACKKYKRPIYLLGKADIVCSLTWSHLSIGKNIPKLVCNYLL